MDEEIVTSVKNRIRTIIFNRPKVKNAFSQNMYDKLRMILDKDAFDDNIAVTIMTGCGDYYSSGNDIRSAMLSTDSSKSLNRVKELIQSFINYPKLLIAVVNGPAIGIAATSVALCDIVYASDTAYFETPFLKLGLCAEGASSFTFPWILGRSKASEMLFLNHRLTVDEAYKANFIAKIIPHAEINNFINSLQANYGNLSVSSVALTKRLITANLKDTLLMCNAREIKQLNECILSDEFSEAIVKFSQRKSKL